MKRNILFIILVVMFTSCCQYEDKWKVVEIEGVCRFEIPQRLQCSEDNEFVKNLEIIEEPHICTVQLDEKKAYKQNILSFVSDNSRYTPYKLEITIDEKDYFSERYAETVMKIADNAIPYLEKNLLPYYKYYENITEDDDRDFEWLPIRIVEKDGLRYAVIEYKMLDDNDNLVRVVHSIFLFDGKRVIFSIYSNEKQLLENEDKYMRFIESVTFDNRIKKSYRVYSDINTQYVFRYPKGFDLTENQNDYVNLGYAHTIRLRTEDNTIDVAFYENFNDNTIEHAKLLFSNIFKNIKFYNVETNKIKKPGYVTRYFEFNAHDKEYFKGNGLVIEGMSTTILNAILSKESEEIGYEAMDMIMNSIHMHKCTFDPYIIR